MFKTCMIFIGMYTEYITFSRQFLSDKNLEVVIQHRFEDTHTHRVVLHAPSTLMWWLVVPTKFNEDNYTSDQFEGNYLQIS